MANRLDTQDRVLLISMVPLFLAVLVLHAYESHRTGLAQLPVFAEWHPGDYPSVGGFRLETDSSGSGLEQGDRLIRIGDRDLLGVGYIGFQAIGLARTTPGHPTELEFERDGIRRIVPFESRPHPAPWSRIPTLLLTAGFSVLLLLRAPKRADVRRFYLCFMTYAIAQAHFYGGPEWQSWLAQIVWSVGSVAMIYFLMNWVRSFPPELSPEFRMPAGAAWLSAALYFLFIRGNYLLAWPLPIDWVPPLSFATHGIFTVLALSILTWNYRKSPPVGQRRLRWILFGTSVGSLPVVLAGLTPTLLPEWDGFRTAFAIGFMSSLIWMVGALIAVLRDNAFDIDRLIGATAAGTIAIGVGGAGIVVAVPVVSDFLANDYGIDPTTTRLALAALVGAAIMTTARRLGPRIESLLFPHQIEQEREVARISESLRSAHTFDELLEGTIEGLKRVFSVDEASSYLQVDGGYVRRFEDRDDWPSIIETPAATTASMDPTAFPREIADVAHAICPIADRNVEAPIALLCLGEMRTGDIYTHRDMRLLKETANACEREWLRLQRQLAEADAAAKTNILAEASHDLRQPLQAVSLLTGALKGKLGDPKVEEMIERISESTHDLDEMLSLLLDRSRLDAGAVEPKIETLRVRDLFDTLARDFAGPAEESGTRLRFVGSNLSVRTDRLLAVRILRNLISNALRYAKGGTVLVGVRRTARAERLRFEVRDNGPGISEEDQRVIFESFVQLPNHERIGLGLGLSIVDDLVRLLGDRIEIRSELGRGSTFGFTVDRARRNPTREEGEAADRHTYAAASSVEPRVSDQEVVPERLLILEDDRAVRESTALLAREWGYECRTAEDFESAQRIVADGWIPSLLVSDYHLANDELGPDAVNRLRKSIVGGGAPRPGAVFLMAEKSSTEFAAVEASGDYALRKPVRPARLRSLLRAVACKA